MTGHVSEHRTAIHVFATQGLDEINAVDHVVLRTLDVQHAENRRIQIVRLNPHVTVRAGLGDTRPDDHSRNANPALVNPALATAQRVIAGDGS